LRRALVVGSAGQDGSYLTEYLRAQNYTIAGIERGATKALDGRIVDIQDALEVEEVLSSFGPDEIYYLAAFHHSSEDLPSDDHELIQRSFEINTLGLNNFLLGITRRSAHSRLFYAASSHVFGEPAQDIQNENTPLNPMDAYGISKASGLFLCHHYRKQRNVHCSAGILYNHESPRRSTAFVSQKVVRAAVRISKRQQDKLVVGELDALVDWGYAPDYVEAMWRILQLDEPEDFVIASGALHSVRDLVQTTFEILDLDWTAYVESAPAITQKQRTKTLHGDTARLESRTGWRPKTSFREMMVRMVQDELQK
jgi:GDPmannose 4,6-dehydratase